MTVDFKQLILTSTLVQELGVFFARSSVLYEFSIVLENDPTSSDMTTKNIFENHTLESHAWAPGCWDCLRASDSKYQLNGSQDRQSKRVILSYQFVSVSSLRTSSYAARISSPLPSTNGLAILLDSSRLLEILCNETSNSVSASSG